MKCLQSTTVETFADSVWYKYRQPALLEAFFFHYKWAPFAHSIIQLLLVVKVVAR